MRIKTILTAILVTVFMSISFCSCEEDEVEKEQTEVWEPYQVESNTTFEYDYDIYESDELTYSGHFTIDVGNPKVTINGNFDTYKGEESNTEWPTITENSSDDVEENFEEALDEYPFTGALYNDAWPDEFKMGNIEIGYSFDYNGGVYSVQIIDKRTYAGYEGYVAEIKYEEASDVKKWEACINKNFPIALMSHFVDTEAEEKSHFELTNYEE